MGGAGVCPGCMVIVALPQYCLYATSRVHKSGWSLLHIMHSVEGRDQAVFGAVLPGGTPWADHHLSYLALSYS